MTGRPRSGLAGRIVQGLRAATARVLGLVLLAPVYLLVFPLIRLARRMRGAPDPLNRAFPGPAGSLWHPRPAAPVTRDWTRQS